VRDLDVRRAPQAEVDRRPARRRIQQTHVRAERVVVADAEERAAAISDSIESASTCCPTVPVPDPASVRMRSKTATPGVVFASMRSAP
jgi:hypothetical protein